jgi:hypothetical protein
VHPARRKRPPYAKLLSQRAPLVHNNWWVLIGADSWNTARTWAERPHRVFALCPPETDPAAFDWSTFADAPFDRVAVARSGSVDADQLRALVHALLSAGSPPVYDLLGDQVHHPTESRRSD